MSGREKGLGRGDGGCQKCLLCQVDLLSELHFTECSQIFISLKAPRRYEQARIHICHHRPFYRVRRFLFGSERKMDVARGKKKSEKNTFPSVFPKTRPFEYIRRGVSPSNYI